MRFVPQFLLGMGMLFLATACTPKPTIELANGQKVGEYRVAQFTIDPNEDVRTSSYAGAAGDAAGVEQFKATVSPRLIEALQLEGAGQKPVNMHVEVTYISTSINSARAWATGDNIGVGTIVTLTDPQTQQVIAKDRVGAIAKMANGLIGAISDAADSKTDADYMQMMAAQYVQQFLYKFYPDTHPQK